MEQLNLSGIKRTRTSNVIPVCFQHLLWTVVQCDELPKDGDGCLPCGLVQEDGGHQQLPRFGEQLLLDQIVG